MRIWARLFSIAAALAVVAGGSIAAELAIAQPPMVGNAIPANIKAQHSLQFLTWQERKQLQTSEMSGTGWFVHRADEQDLTLWTWRAESGNLVHRLRNGMFRLVKGDCVANFCRKTDCRQAKWPVFICDDNIKRSMSAPDMATMVFNGVRYSRLTSASAK